MQCTSLGPAPLIVIAKRLPEWPESHAPTTLLEALPGRGVGRAKNLTYMTGDPVRSAAHNLAAVSNVVGAL